MNTTELDTADILAACLNFVPVNARVDQAIAAHRIAFSTFDRKSDDPNARQLAMFTLRAVIVAWTPKISDSQKQLDYLTGLPEIAWEPYSDCTLQEVREATLGAIGGCIHMMLAR